MAAEILGRRSTHYELQARKLRERAELSGRRNEDAEAAQLATARVDAGKEREAA